VTVSRKTLAAGTKLAVFTVVSVLVTGVLVAIMGRFGTGDTVEYSAIFSNASLLQEGDDVRVAGVVLGKVESVDVYGADRAKVAFTVAKDLPLTTASTVEIRYLNLVGDRYLTVTEGKPGADRIRPGSTIPMSRTVPALDLTALYNGFAPLFSALEPHDVNELALNLIKVLQGEGGTVEGLMAHTASLTTAIANRDKLVGEVITNLNGMLGTVDSRHRQLTELIQQLRRWVGGLAQDKVEIGNSVVNLSRLTATLADFLVQGRPVLKGDIAQLRRLATILARPDTKKVLATVLHNLPEMLADQTRTGTYGSWYSYYVCGASGNIKLPDALKNVNGLSKLLYDLKNIEFHSTAKRCNL
jgi:phospholipid/cholesterol/gamma-HCH transport system substrate-binding protein